MKIEITDKMLEEADAEMPEILKGLYFHSDLKEAITAAIDASEQIQTLLKIKEASKALLEDLERRATVEEDGTKVFPVSNGVLRNLQKLLEEHK